jgi:hypothetical protein
VYVDGVPSNTGVGAKERMECEHGAVGAAGAEGAVGAVVGSIHREDWYRESEPMGCGYA